MMSFHEISLTTCVVWISCNFYGRSSMVPGSRNPMWGEEFNFSVDELPVQVSATISHFLFQKDLKLRFLCSVLNFTLLWSPHHRFKVQTWHDLQKLFREQWFCCIVHWMQFYWKSCNMAQYRLISINYFSPIELYFLPGIAD